MRRFGGGRGGVNSLSRRRRRREGLPKRALTGVRSFSNSDEPRVGIPGAPVCVCVCVCDTQWSQLVLQEVSVSPHRKNSGIQINNAAVINSAGIVLRENTLLYPLLFSMLCVANMRDVEGPSGCEWDRSEGLKKFTVSRSELTSTRSQDPMNNIDENREAN
ncbi:hypothetical protein F2P81_000238 [Scophthalmus maximus]|uniref:Uncharacterized protein n=1 Tax=Scophthalmus maximus TaxID=52904 RepID=A0A6A4TMR8_SCOMX|nr:hypothetical protein F2P81_000238 [Scophthalmus maximus]